MVVELYTRFCRAIRISKHHRQQWSVSQVIEDTVQEINLKHAQF